MTTVVVPNLGHAPLFTQQGIGTTPGYDAIDLRRADSGSLQEGVIAAGDLMVTQRGAGANMSVDIASGSARVQGDTVTDQALYPVAAHGAGTINEALAAADVSNPRVDQVVLQVRDNVHDASGANDARTFVIQGAPTSGANLNNRSGAAVLPGSTLLLADVWVQAGVTSIDNTKIRDRRKFARGVYDRTIRTANAAAGNDYTTTSLTVVEVDSTNLKPRIECAGLPVRVTFRGQATNSGANTLTEIQLLMDGAVMDGGQQYSIRPISANNDVGFTATWDVVPSAGSHQFSPGYLVGAASTATLFARAVNPLCFTVEEIVRQNTANNTTTSG